jgi:hypothetical protein
MECARARLARSLSFRSEEFSDNGAAKSSAAQDLGYDHLMQLGALSSRTEAHPYRTLSQVTVGARPKPCCTKAIRDPGSRERETAATEARDLAFL